MFNDWMFSKDLDFVHFYHTLFINKEFTLVIFSQLAAPLMLLRIGDDYENGTPFLTSMMNLIQLKYMY